MLHAQFLQVTPRIKAGVVTVIKLYPKGVVSDLLEVSDQDFAFAPDRNPLIGAVSLNFGAWTMDTKIFRTHAERIAVIEGDGEFVLLLVEPNF